MKLKEQRMEAVKSQKNYYIDVLLLAVIIFLACCHSRMESKFEDEIVGEYITTSPPYIAFKATFQKDSFQIVMNESDHTHLIDSLLPAKRKDLYSFLRENVLKLDSLAFRELLPYIVVPQSNVDSIYNGKVENLLSYYINDNKLITKYESDNEKNYVIYLLFQHGIYLQMDCETGDAGMIAEQADISK